MKRVLCVISKLRGKCVLYDYKEIVSCASEDEHGLGSYKAGLCL